MTHITHASTPHYKNNTQHSPAGAKPPTGSVGASVQPGDLLLSNHTSPLEVLYLASRFLPAFVAPAGVAPQVGGIEGVARRYRCRSLLVLIVISSSYT